MSKAKAAPRRAARNPDATADALLAIAGAMKAPTHVMGEPMVGIRNISNYTIGERSPFKDEVDLHLAAPRYEVDHPLTVIADPNACAQVSHKWWLQLRRGNLLKKGMIVRDDAVLSTGVARAPDDEPGALPVEWHINAIVDPVDWIESKDDAQLKAGVASLVAEESLRRLLTTVNQRVEFERRALMIKEDNQDSNIEELAVRNMPWRFKIVEEAVLERLEKDFYGRFAT